MSFLKGKIFGALAVLSLIGVVFFSQSKENSVAPKDDSPTIASLSPIEQTNSSRQETGMTDSGDSADAHDDGLADLIGNAITELGAIDQEESAYISALTGSSKIYGGDADHLNKIDFSTLSIQKKRPVEQPFEIQMDALVNDLMGDQKTPVKTTKTTTATIQDNKDNGASVAEYIASLSKEVKTRENEVRMIKVAAGETLWIIANRAYGDGNLYKKIYKANPHIRNPNMIEVGDVLRVPL